MLVTIDIKLYDEQGTDRQAKSWLTAERPYILTKKDLLYCLNHIVEVLPLLDRNPGDPTP